MLRKNKRRKRLLKLVIIVKVNGSEFLNEAYVRTEALSNFLIRKTLYFLRL
ncbi:hypothetical protein J5U23_00410 [Saccharolobus shibatae B12]|uniref:Uncharacterized protein n=1 Tax=Saccharolobus shibatae (strain ATCC 51178 / DSM 5389 / JCM 8931 / NBRC 15437 / B12) TaxID=523848 RepID=A0A8F5BLL9_SACSH|nr:hypothetical protein J5U23_00410 [Saccharolobus shibatae B12]